MVYCRISRDVEGAGLGVERQRQDCLDLCQRRGWEVAGVATDNDVSAYSGRRRPAYEEALRALTDGAADVLVAWHPDRLHRSPRELEDFVTLIEQTGAGVATVTAGDVDLSTPEGRLQARIVGAVARKESEDKSRRLRRKHAEIAAAGKLAGGGNRPFGFKADRITLEPREVRLVREAARRVLAGESLYAIAADWTERGVPTSTGAKWSTTAIRTVLTAPRTAGLRAHRGEIVGDAVWKPMLDRETWEAARAVLATRSKSRTRAPRSYLLSGGIARCGNCGHALEAAPRPYGRAYACLRPKGGCNGVSIKADPLEELIVESLFRTLDGADLEAFDRGDDGGAVDELADIDQRLADIVELFAAGDITRAEMMRARRTLENRKRIAEEEVAEYRAPSPARQYAGREGALRKAWPKLGLDQQRAIISSVIEVVTIASAGRAGGKVDLDRVDVTWRV